MAGQKHPVRLAHKTTAICSKVVGDDLATDPEGDSVRLGVGLNALPTLELEYEKDLRSQFCGEIGHFVPSIATSPKNDDLGTRFPTEALTG